MCMLAAVAPSSVDLNGGPSASSAAAVSVCPPPPPPPKSHTLPLSGHRQLSRLRRAAFLLYQSQPLCIIISRLEVSQKNLICLFFHIFRHFCDISCRIVYLHKVRYNNI